MSNTVENNEQEIALDDAALVPAEPEGESLDTILTEEAKPAKAPESQAPPAKEPGWMKGRIAAEVAKAEARLRAEYEAKLAPIYEGVLDRQAQEMVDRGDVKTLELAKEYLRLKQGTAPVAPSGEAKVKPSETPAERQGGAQKEADPAIRARSEILAKQAQKIQQSTGVNVMELFNSSAEVKQKIGSGEWDFYDVLEQASGPARRMPPVPVRSPNGAQPDRANIANMSAEQFKKLQDNLASGRMYDMRK